jgi:hypothetical protein
MREVNRLSNKAAIFKAFALGLVAFIVVVGLVGCGDSSNTAASSASPTPTPPSIDDLKQQWKKEEAEWRKKQAEMQSANNHPASKSSGENVTNGSSSADAAIQQVDRELSQQKREYERHKRTFGNQYGALRISAETLYRAYDANEVAADEKYKGKAVIITGKIQNIGKDILGSPFVIVGGSGMLDGVQCMFAKSATSSLASLIKGRTVTIGGTVSGKMLSWVMMSDCQLQ